MLCLTENAAQTILVVDDDSQFRRSLRLILSSAGYVVREARNGYEAIDEITADRPELVLLDLNMPGIDGFETCKRIRAASEVGIIALSVRADEKDKVTVLDAGADDHIAKPFGTPELLARIRRLAQTLQDQLAPFVSAGLQVDFSRRRIIANDRPVHLTPMEFKLLQYFVANRGKPLTHLSLLRLLWGPARSPDPDLLRVYISNLRKKIEPDPAQPSYIHTEPYVGYRFDSGFSATKVRACEE